MVIQQTGTQSRYTVIEANGISLLRIEPVRAGRDDAPYECIAENGVGDAVSAEATLTVYESDKTPSGFPVIEVCENCHLMNERNLFQLTPILYRYNLTAESLKSVTQRYYNVKRAEIPHLKFIG